MPTTAEHIRPLFMLESSGVRYPALRKGAIMEVDIAIVGAGFTGLTAAYQLRQAGRSVAVIDMAEVSSGESGLSTAHLTEILDARFKNLISSFGQDKTTLAAHSSRKAIDWMEQRVREFGIDCFFERVTAYLYTDQIDMAPDIDSEIDAAVHVGVAASRMAVMPDALKARAALRVPNQAQMHPRKYLEGLAQALFKNGCLIYEHSRAETIEDGSPCKITTSNGAVIIAKDVIVATHSPSCNLVFLHTKIAPYRSYVLGARVKGNPLPPGLFMDTNDPYHYLRMDVADGEPILLVGGEDHRTGDIENTDKRFENLELYLNTRFEVTSIPYRWSGQVFETIDGLPFIGKNSASEHLYVGTGYAGNGTTFGTLAGIIISDLILGRHNPYAELYHATRVSPIAGARDFLAETFSMIRHFVGDRLKPEELHTTVSIPPGEGRIVSLQGTKYAIYKNENGHCSIRSASCTHLGGVLHWNNSEKSWDCPCHGARFSALGKVLCGPAMKDLAEPELIEGKNLSLRT